MGVFVIAARIACLKPGLETVPRLLCYESVVFGDALNLNAAPAHGHLRVFQKLLGLPEILVGLEKYPVIVEQTAHVADAHMVVEGAGQRHHLSIAQFFKQQVGGLLKGQIFIYTEIHPKASFALRFSLFFAEFSIAQPPDVSNREETPD